jgi:hypothetical protein
MGNFTRLLTLNGKENTMFCCWRIKKAMQKALLTPIASLSAYILHNISRDVGKQWQQICSIRIGICIFLSLSPPLQQFDLVLNFSNLAWPW